jgi:PKD repeat protein
MKKLILILGLILVFGSYIQSATDTTCIANFNYEIAESYGKPSIIKFENLSEGEITAVHWDFGDGSTSAESNPLHYFPANGNYEVLLRVSNNLSSDEITKTISVSISLSVDFSFKLDTNNVVPNTFIFSSTVLGPYDQLIWKFGKEVIADVKDTIHSFALEDHDYQVTLSAIYTFNDTSRLIKAIAKGLTTARYMDLGGQIFLGDSLMNNPYPTGDTGIAVLYRMDYDQLIPVDTNFFTELGYFWFYQKLKAHYLVKVSLTEFSGHGQLYATTYSGNTTQWDEAQIVNLAQDKYREDIFMVKNQNKQSGTLDFRGHVDDLMEVSENLINPYIYLYNTENQLINLTVADEYGDFSFENLEKGHYILTADFTGLPSRSKLLSIDFNRPDIKSAEIETSANVFPNPARSYCLIHDQGIDNQKNVKIQIINLQGQILGEQSFSRSLATGYYRIDLSEMPHGVLMLKIYTSEVRSVKILHQ